MAYTIEKLYIIRTYHIDENNPEPSGTTDAIFIDLVSAIQAVDSNECDLCEDGFNQYVVIGEIETGMYPIVEEVLWFKWDNQDKYYKSCKRPEFATGFCYSL